MSNLDTNSLQGFLSYAKEANTRSTLAAEDGLKPVHRRILFGMAEEKYFSDKELGGSAKIVGSVLGNFHPHGDASVYDAALRMSQTFKMRYPLVDFKGNSGSILDPDSYAAMRYTKMRLSQLGELMLKDIEKNTVPMVETYDGKLLEPVTLPSMLPNILLNGGMGIGVGVSSSLVPHNLKEVCDGIIAYIGNPRITTEELMQHIQGPDFPTGGVVTDAFSLKETYESGKGTVKLRAKYSIATIGGRTHIVVTEVPYLISIESRIIGPIKELYMEDENSGIYEFQNASGNEKGLELHIILEKDANVNSVLQKLFEKTGLETTVKINQTVMLADGSFVTLNLRGLIAQYLKHQHNVLINKYNWELQKAQDRLHIVDGLIVAVSNIDEVVRVIKTSESTAKAKQALMDRFILSDKQSAAILDMRLARLTSLEVNKLNSEKIELTSQISDFKNIIESSIRREQIVIKFLKELKTKFGDSRRTRVTEMTVIEKGEHVYLTVDSENKFNSIPKDEISTMTRGKKGSSISKARLVATIECNTKDSIMMFDIEGKAYHGKVSDIINGLVVPEAQIIQFLTEEEDKDYMVFVTSAGIIKKTPRVVFKKSTQVTKVKEGDSLIGMYFANDNDFIMALGTEGKVINLAVSDIAAIGKLTYGAKGMSTERVIAATVASSDDIIFTLTSENKAKLTPHSDYTINSKGSTGQVTTEDCIFILNMKTKSFITLFGDDGKALTLNISSLATKSKTATGAKIFSSNVVSINSL